MKNISLEIAKEKVLRPIIDSGFSAYIAGGSVRDYFFNEDFSDIDICTDASEEELKKLFDSVTDISKNMNLKVFLIKVENQKFEVAHFRCNEHYDNHRSPTKVDFDCKLKEDAARRDFSLNAMFLSEGGDIIDFFHGQEDIKNKIIRAVGNPEERFEEDILRILRAIRFAVKYDFNIEENTYKAIKDHPLELSLLPAERITNELEKIMKLGGEKFGKSLEIMFDSGVLQVILPEIAIMKDFPHDITSHPEGFCLAHTIAAIKTYKNNDVNTLWSILFHDIAKPITYQYRLKKSTGKYSHTYYNHDKKAPELIEKVGNRLKLSRNTIEIAKYCALYHMIAFRFKEMKPKKSLKIIRNKYFNYLMEVSEADLMSRNIKEDKICLEERNQFIKKFQEAAEKINKIDGEKIIEITGLPSGPGIGKVLNLIGSWIITQNVKNGKPFPPEELINQKIFNFGKMVKGDINARN